VSGSQNVNQTLNPNIVNYLQGIPIQKNPQKLRISPYLDPSLRPSESLFTLTPELEPLHQLIMLQHEAFLYNIKELGDTTISLTSAIDNKINSYNQLKFHNKTPRSLCIKCKLTTSPDFTSDHIFLSLRENLDNSVANFIAEGTKIMTDWMQQKIKLLQIQRCSNLLSKSLPILECLTAFHLEILGNPSWPSVGTDKISIFL
jgi:hypothetical protein